MKVAQWHMKPKWPDSWVPKYTFLGPYSLRTCILPKSRLQPQRHGLSQLSVRILQLLYPNYVSKGYESVCTG